MEIEEIPQDNEEYRLAVVVDENKNAWISDIYIIPLLAADLSQRFNTFVYSYDWSLFYNLCLLNFFILYIIYNWFIKSLVLSKQFKIIELNINDWKWYKNLRLDALMNDPQAFGSN